MSTWQQIVSVLAWACFAFSGMAFASEADEEKCPFTLVVMDPLCAQLACDCVEGYAQRDYEKFGAYLAEFIGREVKVVYAASLNRALETDAAGHFDLVIGKHSVVLYDARQGELRVEPVAQLTGKDGTTTQMGLFVVRSDDPAQTLREIAGYRIFFGPEDCDEKSAVPMTLLQAHGVPLPDPVETVPACSEGATRLLELGPGVRAAAVISSYAEPLLEGCGTIQKGDLRVIGTTEPIPFISAFVRGDLSPELKAAVVACLLEVQYDLEMMSALESRRGFVPVDPDLLNDESETVAEAKKNEAQ